jgi:outer membrane protein TolC
MAGKRIPVLSVLCSFTLLLLPLIGTAGDDLELPTVKPVTPEPAKAVAGSPKAKTLAINLDTVFRLTNEQNVNIAVARAKVQQASVEEEMKVNGILHRMDCGMSYYKKIEAEAKLLEAKAHLRKVASETLIEAGSTYIDLVASLHGQAIAESMQKDMQELLTRAQKMAAVEPGFRVEAVRIQAQLKARERVAVELRESAARASAKLAYLMGVGMSTTLEPADTKLIVMDLVDVTPGTAELVAKALANGPGVREAQGLVALADSAVQKSQGRNMMNLLTHGAFSRDLEAKSTVAHLSYQDLQGKLTAGVRESREAIVEGKEQAKIGEDESAEARRGYQLSKERLENNVPGVIPSEGLLSLQALAQAQTNHVQALRSLDKAEVRLVVYLGLLGGDSTDGDCSNPAK